MADTAKSRLTCCSSLGEDLDGVGVIVVELLVRGVVCNAANNVRERWGRTVICRRWEAVTLADLRCDMLSIFLSVQQVIL